MPTVSIKTRVKIHNSVESIKPEVGKFFQVSYDEEVYVAVRLTNGHYYVVGKNYAYEPRSAFMTDGLFLGYLEQGDSFSVVI